MNYLEADTPSLIIDKDIMDNNLNKMANLCKKLNIRLRPHIKTHKMVEIAKTQVMLSNYGIAVSKLGEAEVMQKAGIDDILIANQIIGQKKINRLNSLLPGGQIKVCVDSVEGIKYLQDYLKTGNNKLKVLIEIDTGMNRCGISSYNKVEDIIFLLKKSDKLLFEGFMSHSGNIYGAKDRSNLRQIALDEAKQMEALANYCRERGIDVNEVSIGSTPSSYYLDKMSGFTEFRPGNYVFYDYIQICLGIAAIEDCALSVLTTVVSKPQSNRIVIDAGSKSLGLDKGAHSKEITSSYGYIKEIPNCSLERLSEEHGIVKVTPGNTVRVGQKLTIIPNHACAVTNLFDEALVQKNGKIVDSWKVAARGKVQ